MSFDDVIIGFVTKDYRDNFERLTTFTLLDYEYKLVNRLYIADSRSSTQALDISLSYIMNIRM